MKIFFIIVLILGIGYFAWNALQTAPSESIPQAVVSDTAITPAQEEVVPVTETAPSAVVFDNQNISIGFTGYGPGKEHVGTLAVQGADLVVDEKGNITGKIVVDMNSINADVPAVSTHLKSKDFFDATKYPVATFVISSVKENTLSGKLTLHGITKDISFPFTKEVDTYKTEFRVNMKDFGIVQKFANEEFVVRVSVPLKK